MQVCPPKKQDIASQQTKLQHLWLFQAKSGTCETSQRDKADAQTAEGRNMLTHNLEAFCGHLVFILPWQGPKQRRYLQLDILKLAMYLTPFFAIAKKSISRRVLTHITDNEHNSAKKKEKMRRRLINVAVHMLH